MGPRVRSRNDGVLNKSSMRFLISLLCLLLCACSSRSPEPAPKIDETKEAWYGEAVSELAGLVSSAEVALRAGNRDQASGLIQEGEPIMARLLKVRQPTLAAVEAASDLDDLYGRMLLSNRHYGWARMIFQRNVARWKSWEPQTEETVRRRKLAESGIIECDKNIR